MILEGFRNEVVWETKLRIGSGLPAAPGWGSIRGVAGGFSFDSLNMAQREAVGALDGPVLILAGAGTGKTRTVTCRIANMLDRGIRPEEILAVTFTNKAAHEMRDRIGGMVSKKAADEMTVSTFHSLCVKLLRGGIDRLGYKKNFAIYTGSDQVGLLRQLIVRKGGANEKVKPEAVLAAISKAKNNGIDPGDHEDDFFAMLGREYQNELRAQNAVDFDDLLVLAEKMMREHEDVRSYWRSKFDRVTVDEFQDTNALQMQLLQQLVGNPYHVCVVGDDDQSIYGFRGAEVANILQFEKFFPDPRVIRLEENYRSTQAILHTANSLIRRNAGRREKTLRATKLGGEPLRVIAMPGDEEEADFIGEEILADKATLQKKWEDFAILIRTNTQSRKIEEKLRELKIPYRMVGAQSFFDRREIRDVLAYLQTVATPEADVALLRILNTPARGIGQSSAVLAVEYSRMHNKSVWEALCDPGFTSELSTKVRNSIETFVSQIAGTKARIEIGGENLGEACQRLFNEIEYVPWLQRGSKTDNERQQRAEGVNEVINQLTKHSQKGKDLTSYLESMALASDRDDDDLEKKQGVTLITLHASKGLEFPYVYLVGLEQGILPHKRSIEEGTQDEERRLLYVGITRAQEKLTISYCAHRMKWGERTSCQPSVFLMELDDEFLTWTNFDDIMGAEANEEELGNFFGSLKGFLEE